MTDTARRWMRWAVRGALMLGVATSITANILHARDNPISQAISAWPPLALLITVELVSRIPLYRKGLGVVRLLATAAIAGIAAYISYWHMVGVVARYGETGAVPYLLPLSVDGLIVVASVSLVELADRQEPVASAGTVTAPAESVSLATPDHAVSAAEALSAPAVAPAAPAAPAHSQQPRAQDPEHTTTNHQESWAEPTETASRLLPASAPENVDSDQGDRDDRDDRDDADEDIGTGLDLASDLVPLLSAARVARDELIREGRTVSRDALAHRLRRNGHAIRNNRVSELLNTLRREEPAPTAHTP